MLNFVIICSAVELKSTGSDFSLYFTSNSWPAVVLKWTAGVGWGLVRFPNSYLTRWGFALLTSVLSEYLLPFNPRACLCEHLNCGDLHCLVQQLQPVSNPASSRRGGKDWPKSFVMVHYKTSNLKVLEISREKKPQPAKLLFWFPHYRVKNKVVFSSDRSSLRDDALR